MSKDHPAEQRPNRYQAKCATCGFMVEPGDGLTSKVMGKTREWRTVHLPGQCNKYEDMPVHPFSDEAFDNPFH